jgi:hypothetical protein
MPDVTIALSDAQLTRFKAAYNAQHGADPTLDQVTAYVKQWMVSFVTDSERHTKEAAVTVTDW